MKKTMKLLPVMAAMALLVACGGGGDDGPAAGAGSGGAGGSGGAAAASRYAGNWKSLDGVCYDDNEVKIRANGIDSPAYSDLSPFEVIATANGLQVSAQRRIFDNANCSGQPRATHRIVSNFTFEGQRVVEGKTVDLISYRDEPIGGGISAGNTIILNNVVYPGNYFTRFDQGSGLSYLQGNLWFLSYNDDDTYPTSFVNAAELERL